MTSTTLDTPASSGPFILSYGTREGTVFTERVSYLLDDTGGDKTRDASDNDTPEARALKYMSYWQSSHMSFWHAISALKSLEEKTAFLHYFLIASTQENPVVTVEERMALMKALMEQCTADDLFTIGSMLTSRQALFSSTLLTALEESLENIAVVPLKIRDIFAKIESLNIKSGYTLFPMNRYYIPPHDVDRPAPYRTFLYRCQVNGFKGSFFWYGNN